MILAVVFAVSNAERPRLRHSRRLCAPSRQLCSACVAQPRGVRALLPTRSPAQLADAAWHTGLPILLLAASNTAVGALLRACSISFSPPLASMLALTASMCALGAAAPAAAERTHAFFRPGCALLSRWLPVFYLPALVALARSRPSASGSELLAFGAFCVVSLFANSACTVALMRALRSRTPPPPPSEARAAAALTAGPSRAPALAPRRWLLVARLGALTASSVAAAAVCGPAYRDACVQLSLLCATLLGLGLGEVVPARVRVWLHPIVTATAFTSLALGAAAALGGAAAAPSVGAEYAAGAGRLLGSLLSPTVASFAFALFGYRAQIAASLGQLLAAICLSSAAGLAGSALAARALGLPSALRAALVPRSITTPLALEAAQLLGADRELVLFAVCVTGLCTVPFGRPLMRACGVHDPAERGVALGCAGNGGSTLALADDAEAFPFSVIAMVLNGAVTVVLLSSPWVRRLLLPA